MKSLSYGAVVGGMLGVFCGWAPAFAAPVIVMTATKGNAAFPFWWLFFGSWVTVALLATSSGAGIGYLVGRRIADE